MKAALFKRFQGPIEETSADRFIDYPGVCRLGLYQTECDGHLAWDRTHHRFVEKRPDGVYADVVADYLGWGDAAHWADADGEHDPTVDNIRAALWGEYGPLSRKPALTPYLRLLEPELWG